jgi:hypothetical protein
MSFCRILSTLCRQVVFHIVPHFSRGRQKSGTKSTSYNRRSGTKSKKPSTFCPALLKSEKNIVKNHSFCLDHQTDHYQGDGGFREGGIREGEIVDG